ncbi:MAG TPA: MlaD family protein [Solirubrobacteraceae bacterium]|nr:MlaD family protein [Solirubrobacteraceae bacterium]
MTRFVRVAAVAALLLIAAAVVVLVVHRGPSGYRVRVVMADAGGLQSGSNVNVNGVTVGTVTGLSVNRADRAVATLVLDRAAAPIGAGATATVAIDGFFGERIMDLTRGSYRRAPEPSGATIPVSRSAVSVRLDNVLDALNPDAQGALRTFLDEQGTALVGRGQSLSAVLAQLPDTLPALGSLLSALSSDQRALGELVDRSSQVAAAVAPQRTALATMVNRADAAFTALASRRNDLGASIQRAPATLAQATRTLAQLQGTAIPLAPAADGLRATVPSLLSALRTLPSFATAAVPTLDRIDTVAPALDRLAADGTPIVSRVVPVARELTAYSARGFAPLLSLLDGQGGAANLFGEMEGWARSTQGYDAAGHVFRFGATFDPQSFAQLLATLNPPTTPAPAARPRPVSRPATPTGRGAAPHPGSGLASGLASSVSSTVANLSHGLQRTLQGVGSAVSQTVGGVSHTISGGLGALSSGRSHPQRGRGAGTGTATTPSAAGSAMSSLLHYLLGR